MADPVTILLSAAVTAALSSTGPSVIRRLPEPTLDSDAAGKTAYTELAARPGLAASLAAVGAVAGGLVGWKIGAEPVLAAWIYLCAVGVVLAYVDSRTRLLPTRIIAPSYAVLAVLLLLCAWADRDPHLLLDSALGWLAMGGFYVILWLVYPSGLGYGDVRLSGMLGLALGILGWGALVTGLYAGFFIGAIGGGLLAALKIADHKQFAFGPFMLVGALVGVVWGQSLAGWYTSW